MVARTEHVRSLRPYEESYERLGAALGDAVTALFRQLFTDTKQAVEAAVAGIPPAQVAPDTVLTVSLREAARRLDVGLTTVRRLTAEGELESVLVSEGRRVVPVACLEEFVQRLRLSQGSESSPPAESAPVSQRPQLRRR